jgi:anaphase-promoting complex subunit 1
VLIIDLINFIENLCLGPEMENYVERESYSLAAGLALGMVCLETGSKDVGLDDLNLPDTLHYYMVGGTKRGLIGAQRDKYKLKVIK